MPYFKLVAILMHDITNNLAPQNILRLFNSTDQVHAYDTRSSSRGGTTLIFQDWINNTNHFKIWGQNMELHTSEY